MKRTILMLWAIMLLSKLFSAADAQPLTQRMERYFTSTPQQKPDGPTPAEVLGRFKDAEAATLVLREGPYMNLMSLIAYAEFSKPTVVSFKTAMVNPPYPTPEVTLKYEPTGKVYLLSVNRCFLKSRNEFGPDVTDLPLTFIEGTGFSGKGTSTFKGRDLTVEAAINQKGLDHHEWEITFKVGDDKAFQYSFTTERKSQ